MRIGKVVGNVWATRKDEGLVGCKLLVVQLLKCKAGDGGYEELEQVVAVDSVGAGVGEMVLLTMGSTATRVSSEIMGPVDTSVVGIIDQVEVPAREG